MSFELATTIVDFLDSRVLGLGRVVLNRPYVTIGIIVLIYSLYRFFLWMGFGQKVSSRRFLICGSSPKIVFLCSSPSPPASRSLDCCTLRFCRACPPCGPNLNMRFVRYGPARGEAGFAVSQR